jgi:riboflavin synthase
MFTGLVEEAGSVTEILIEGHTARLTVKAAIVHDGAREGDSIAINGCCLTVIAIDGTCLTFDAVPETLARTNLGGLKAGSRVNLERPLQTGARLGGHFVQGHIDGVGHVTAVRPEENAVVIEIELPQELAKYVVEKGSITVDGVSLTVAGTNGNRFSVWTIPHTREITTLGERVVGDAVNIECDLLGKYIERLLQAGVAGGAA